jgi:hypothetical protein
VSTRTNRVALEPDLGGIRRLAESFEIGLAARNLSPGMVNGYLESVRLLAGYLARSGMPTRLDSIAREHVEAFVAAELERVSPTSVHIRYRGLQGYFRLAVSDGEIAVSPMINMRQPALVLLFIVTRNAGVLLVFPRGCSWKHRHPRRPSRRPRARLWTKDRVGRRTHALGFPTPSACFTPMLLAAIDARLALTI